MAIRAYDDCYVGNAQNILGHMVDFAVMTLEVDPDELGDAFAVSYVSEQFARGNPRYVAGMSGCELARKVLKETNTTYTDAEDKMYLDKSPEYWAGWSLAYYQWYTSRTFFEILNTVSLSEMIEMYPVYHEMDITHFIYHIDSLLKTDHPFTRLKIKRMNSGLSQAELARASGVALRQIQLFEQRQRDINNAAAITLLRLSRILNCRIEDLLEPTTDNRTG